MDQQATRVPCPYCLTPAGHVRGLRIARDDRRTLTYICASCQRSWSTEPYLADSLGSPLTVSRIEEGDDKAGSTL